MALSPLRQHNNHFNSKVGQVHLVVVVFGDSPLLLSCRICGSINFSFGEYVNVHNSWWIKGRFRMASECGARAFKRLKDGWRHIGIGRTRTAERSFASPMKDILLFSCCFFHLGAGCGWRKRAASYVVDDEEDGMVGRVGDVCGLAAAEADVKEHCCWICVITSYR